MEITAGQLLCFGSYYVAATMCNQSKDGRITISPEQENLHVSSALET